MNRSKRIEVNTEVLNKYLADHAMNYVQLAAQTGLCATQAFHLTKKSNAGSGTVGALAPLNIPHLFQLVTYEKKGGKTRKVSIQPVIIKA